MSAHVPGRADPVVVAILFLAATASYACFSQSADSPNVRTHMFLALAMAEDRSLRIDPYRPYTLDRATVDGHTYSEKAPGLALTAAPVVAAARAAQFRALPDAALLGRPPLVTEAFRRLTRRSTLASVGVLGALGVVAAYLAGLRLGAGSGGAVFGACVLAWATPFWGWSTAMLGHVPAASCLTAGLVLILVASSRDAARAAPASIAGAFLGWAAVIEFPAAGAAALIAAYGVRCLLRSGDGRSRAIAGLLLGGALAVVPLLLYNVQAFGTAWRLGYGSTEPWYPAMKSGLFGVHWPRPAAIGELIAGEKRGLLWFAPAGLAGLLVLPGIVRRAGRWEGALLVAVPLYYLLLVSGYAYWDGGWSTGPRHLTAVMPFLCLALGLAWSAAGPWGRAALATVGMAGAVISFVAVSTSMFAPNDIARPWSDFLVPAFQARWDSRWTPVWGAYATVVPWEHGLGRRLGLAVAALVPCLGVAAVAMRLRSAR
ncbi:MAG TPA: hypothetical protein VKU85_06170 [bacterium]|nr:hypothetical protein [bacterium]